MRRRRKTTNTMRSAATTTTTTMTHSQLLDPEEPELPVLLLVTMRVVTAAAWFDAESVTLTPIT